MDTEPILYTEEGFPGINKVFLSDDEYARALETFIVACADAMIVDRRAKKVYLSKRRAKPMQDTWWVIGGRRAPGVPAREAMQGLFKRETSLMIAPERFEFLALVEYRLKNRQQMPQEKGTHTQGYTFAVELTPEELGQVAANLDPKEYYTELGLRAFSLEEIKNGSHHPAIIALAARALQ